MERKKGSLLEYCVKSIFKNLGLETVTNTIVGGFEVDVYANYKGIRIVTQCKQYEKKEEARDTLADLIIQWSGKRKYLDCDNIIIALWGFDIARRHDELAREERVLLWDNQDIKSILDSSYERPKEIRAEILSRLGITNDEIIRHSTQRAEKLRKNFEDIFSRFSALSKERERYSGSFNLLNMSYLDTCDKIMHLEEITPEMDDETKCRFEYHRLYSLITDEVRSCFRNGVLIDSQKYNSLYSVFFKDKNFSLLRSLVETSHDHDYDYVVLRGPRQAFTRKFITGEGERKDEETYAILGSDGLTFIERLGSNK